MTFIVTINSQQPGGEFWIALSDGEVIGTIGLMLKENDCAVLKKFFVKKEFRSQKVGLALYNELLQFAISKGVQHIILDTPAVARATHRFYENAAMHNENGAWQMIFGVNTLPDYRKHGYAGELIRHAIDDAKLQGRKGLVLTCKERLLPYYGKFGFKDEGVSDKSTHGNVVWYQMRLSF